MNIQTWYSETYPTDNLGAQINPKADFDGLFRILENYGDVYAFLGVTDSLVRERVFEKLAELAQMPYSYIYEQWLKATPKSLQIGAKIKIHGWPMLKGMDNGIFKLVDQDSISYTFQQGKKKVRHYRQSIEAKIACLQAGDLNGIEVLN